MNFNTEIIENIIIMADRLKCIIKIMSENNLNCDEQTILENLMKELGYNINIEIDNVINQ